MSTTIARVSDRTPVPRPEDFRPYRGRLWRVVEAQHRISTNRLAAGIDDQALLEQLVEEVKPTLPRAAQGLHYLLATPFRYGHKSGSRFRAAGERPGIFYAAEHVATAIAETAYWRLRFYSRSPDFRPPSAIVEHSAISVTVAMERLLDLCRAPFARHAPLWTDASDYGACRRFAADARAIDAQAVRYASVRDPAHRANVALFDPSVFRDPAPKNSETWHFRFERGEMTAYAALPSEERYSFRVEDFGLA